MLNNIDLNKLNIFLKVMEFGSLTETSKYVGLSKSAISQAISTLESQLGYALFLRKSKKLYPTRKAEQIHKELEIYQSRLKFVLNESEGALSDVSGVVHIGAYQEFAKAHLIQWVEKFLRQYPHAQIKFHFDSPTVLEGMLEKNLLDLCFSIYPVKGVKGIVSKKVLEEELILLAPKNMYKQCFNLNQLIKLNVIDYFPKHTLFNRWVYKHFKQRKKHMNIRLYAASAEILIDTVELGLGVGVAPDYVYQKFQGQLKNVTVVRPSVNKLIDYIWLNQYEEQFSNSAHKAFYGFIKDELAIK